MWIHKSPCVCHDHSPTLYCFLFSFSFRRDRSEDKGSGDQDQTLSCFPQAGIHLFSKKDKTQRRPNSMSTNPPLTNLTQSLPFPLHSYDYRIKKEASQMKEMFLGISVTDLPWHPMGGHTSSPQLLARSFSWFAFFRICIFTLHLLQDYKVPVVWHYK